MGKKKDVNGFKYRRQGSIDDENFLMLGHGIGTIKEAVEDTKIDLTETNEQLAEIKNAVDNMEVSVELGDINVDLEETNSKLNDINISLQDYLTNLKKKLDDFDNSIEILNIDIEDINYNITQLDLYCNTLDGYITSVNNEISNLENKLNSYDNYKKTVDAIDKYLNSIFSLNSDALNRIQLESHTFSSGETYTYEYSAASNNNFAVLGVVGVRTGNKAIIPYRLQTTYSSGKVTLYAAFINTSTSSVTVSPYVDYLEYTSWNTFKETEM